MSPSAVPAPRLAHVSAPRHLFRWRPPGNCDGARPLTHFGVSPSPSCVARYLLFRLLCGAFSCLPPIRGSNHKKLAPVRSTTSNTFAAKRPDRIWPHAVNQISRSIAATRGSFRASNHVRELGGEACVARLDVSGQPRGDLLQHPAVAVRIAERGVRGVTLSLRIWAAD